MHARGHTHAPQTEGNLIRWAHRYDRSVNLLTLGRARAIRQETVKVAHIQPGESVLDVGCGTGDVTLLAKTAAGPMGQVVGIDAAPEMIEVARHKAAHAGVDIQFQLEAIEKLSFPDASFDVVLSSLMMHHLPQATKRAGLAEVYRVLKPGGRLVIIDFQRPTSFWSKILTTLSRHGGLRVGVQDLAPLLSEAGLTQIETGKLSHMLLGYIKGRK